MLDAMSIALDCPQCDTEFTPRRTNQKYCSDPCRKNATRGDRSRENEDRTIRHFERSQRLAEMIYTTPPNERLGYGGELLERPADSCEILDFTGGEAETFACIVAETRESERVVQGTGEQWSRELAQSDASARLL